MLATRLAQESLPPSPHCWEREARDPNLAGRGQRAKISKDPACLHFATRPESRKIDIYRVDDLKEKGAHGEEDIEVV